MQGTCRAVVMSNHEKLINEYLESKERLKPIRGKQDESKEHKEEIPEEVLNDAYNSLKEVASQMDYDTAEMIIQEVKGYQLGEKDKVVFNEMSKLLKQLDWDGIEKLINEQRRK